LSHLGRSTALQHRLLRRKCFWLHRTLLHAGLAKLDSGRTLEIRYVEDLVDSTSSPNSRLNKGLRRIDVTLPAVLVAELDRNVGELEYFVTRSAVIEVAIRQFLDRGGVRSAAPGTVYR